MPTWSAPATSRIWLMCAAKIIQTQFYETSCKSLWGDVFAGGINLVSKPLRHLSALRRAQRTDLYHYICGNSSNYFLFPRKFISFAVSHKMSFTFFIHLCLAGVFGSILCFIVIQISRKHLISTWFFCLSDFSAKFMGRRLSGNALSSNAQCPFSLWEKRQTQKIMFSSASLFHSLLQKNPHKRYLLWNLPSQISTEAVFKTLD